MSNYDLIYKDLVQEILENGYWDTGENVRTVYADGSPAYTKSVFGLQLEFDDLPISTTKKLAWKTAIKEMLIFWVKQSNKIQDFHDVNCHVWDEWALEDGTIGKSYPYQFESRPDKKIITVKQRDFSDYKNSFSPFIINSPMTPNVSSEDELVGKVLKSNTYGDFLVIDVFKSELFTNGKGAKIQFIDTGYIAEYSRSEVVRGRVKDLYYKRILGIASQGDVSKVKNLTKQQVDLLYSKWSQMISRCYNKDNINYKNYGEIGIKVHDDWLLFENYLRDVRNLPQWHLAKDILGDWHLDKDYYGSQLYSKDTCVWLSKRDNDTYRKQSKPFLVICPDGKEELAISTVDVAIKYGLDTGSISRVLNGKRNMKQTKGYTFKYIEPEDGTLYRYKLSRNQVTDLIFNIAHNPASRRIMTSFWNDAEVDEKALQECAYETIWNVSDGELNLILGQRSLDVGLGCCFNQFQYYILLCMVAQVCNLKVGRLIHQVGSAHIYDRHIDSLLEQVEREPIDTPLLWINPEIKDFNDFTIDDFKLINYNHHGNVSYEVAI